MGFRRLVRDVLIYGTGGVGLQVLGFFTVPVFTRIFTTADYGVIETITSVASILGVLALLGLDSAAQRSFFGYTDEQEHERRGVLSTAFVALVVTSATIGAAGVLGSDLVSRLFFPDDRFGTVIALALAVIPLTTVAAFAQEILRMHHRPGRYTVLSVAGGVSAITLALVFVGALDRGLTGYYLGFLLGGALAALLGLAMVHESLSLRFDRRELRVMLAYGLPLIPVALSTWVLLFADRFFLLHYSGEDELGLYAVAVRLASLLLLGVTAFSLAWSPLMLDLHVRDPDSERVLRARTLNYVTAVLCFGAVALSVYAREFFRTVTGPDFADAYTAVGMLSLTIVAVGVNSVTMSGISIVRATHYFARYAFYAVAVNLALNFLLIPPAGKEGAALATLLTYAGLAALYYYRAQALDPAPFDLSAVLLILGSAVVVIAIGTVITVEPLWLSMLVKVPVVLAFPVLLTVFGIVDRRTLRWLRESTREVLAQRGIGD